MSDTYLTRGRAAELHRAIGELEGRLTARIDGLEAELRRAQELTLERLRRETQAHIDLYKELTLNGNQRRKGST